jgi:hypothetical protein
MLEWLSEYSRGRYLGNTERSVLFGAAEGGHLHVLTWALETLPTAKEKLAAAHGSKVNTAVSNAATKAGQLSVLKFFSENGYPWFSYECTITDAALSGNFEMFEWILAETKKLKMELFSSNTYNHSIMVCAIRGKNLKILQTVLQHIGEIWGVGYGVMAVKTRNLEMVKWLASNGYPISETAWVNAAEIGDIEMLEFLHEIGLVPKECRIVLETFQQGTCACPCLSALCSGELEVLGWAYENGCYFTETSCKIAAKKGHLHILKWLVSKGCPWFKIDCYNMALSGGRENNHIVKWIKNQMKKGE